MNVALGTFHRRIQSSAERNVRGDRGRTIRYQAGRISRGENPRDFLSNSDVKRLNRLVLEETYGDDKVPSQAAADDAGQSKKAAENWLAAENPMGLTAFVNAYRNNARFAAFARYYLLGHSENDPILEIQVQSVLSNMDGAAAQLGMGARQFAAAMGFAMGNTITPDMLAGSPTSGGSSPRPSLDADSAGDDVELVTGDLFDAVGG
jgi:hypothetical protein